MIRDMLDEPFEFVVVYLEVLPEMGGDEVLDLRSQPLISHVLVEKVDVF